MIDYEKAYKAALETATQWIEDGCPYKEKICLESVFPQLRESEDERIRKELVEYHKQQFEKNRDQEVGLFHKDAIAYIEKQKEQKPAEIDESTKRLNENWMKQHFDDYKEQKPAEKQDYSGLTDLERAIHRGFLSAGVENAPITIIKETAQECLAQMKPAEWSEEDENMMNKQNIVTFCQENLPSLPSNLDEAAIQAHIRLEEGERLSFLNIFKAGAEWQKRKMMEGAVEGDVWGQVGKNINISVLRGVCKYLEQEDLPYKVRMIILPKEETDD